MLKGLAGAALVIALSATGAACAPPAVAVSEPATGKAGELGAASAGHGAGQAKERLATATTAEPGEPRALRVSRRAPIEYAMNGKPFPLPIVSGTIAGQKVRMMLDTGANSHIVAGWFMRKAGLAGKKQSDGGTDHSGTAIETYRIDKPDITIDQWGSVGASLVVATEVPKEIEKLGIAAFLSPQALASASDAAVLDLAKPELRAMPWDDAMAELAQRESAGGARLLTTGTRLCEQESGAIHLLSYVVPIAIESERVWLLLDTGAQFTDVFATSPVGKKLAPRSVAGKEALFTAAGKTTTRVIEAAEVRSGSFAVKTDVDLIPGGADPWCARDGVVAMDLLRACTLVLGKGRLEGTCDRGAAPAR
ncbi:MAG: aspartyl protease family protein [Deltaproteobacteria bacterium]|nr:aspartyl protease family protein [Deltaproteobacteria bacterium]